jgi:NH3-dependent NAD+ synthetase
MARTRCWCSSDQSAKLDALRSASGNKTERLLGYYWHADVTPPVNPLGRSFKSQVWGWRYLVMPKRLIERRLPRISRPIQTDEADLGISYARADAILAQQLLLGYTRGDCRTRIVALSAARVDDVPEAPPSDDRDGVDTA